MNFIVSDLSTLTTDKKILKSIKMIYVDIPIPLDYKHQLIKIRVNNLVGNTFLNGVLSTACFIIPVMSAVGYRTIYIPKEDNTVFIKKNTNITLDISFHDMNDQLITFNDKYIIQFYMV